MLSKVFRIKNKPCVLRLCCSTLNRGSFMPIFVSLNKWHGAVHILAVFTLSNNKAQQTVWFCCQAYGACITLQYILEKVVYGQKWKQPTDHVHNLLIISCFKVLFILPYVYEVWNDLRFPFCPLISGECTVLWVAARLQSIAIGKHIFKRLVTECKISPGIVVDGSNLLWFY